MCVKNVLNFRRKILLHTGSSNYRPPHERGKSAPKLKSIEEAIVEEDEEEEEEARAMEEAELHQQRNDNIALDAGPDRLAWCHDLPAADDDDVADQFVGTAHGGVDADSVAPEPDDRSYDQPSFFPDPSISPPAYVEATLAAGATTAAAAASRPHHLSSLDDDEDDEDAVEEENEEEESDCDEVIDYLPQPPPYVEDPSVRLVEGRLRDLDIDSAAASSASPGSNRFSAASISPGAAARRTVSDRGSSAVEDASVASKEIPSVVVKRVSEQDAISDESGYSEESAPTGAASSTAVTSSMAGGLRRPLPTSIVATSPTSAAGDSTATARRTEMLSGMTTVVTLNNCDKKEEEEEAVAEEDPHEGDLTVRSGLVSELNASPLQSTTFSSSARITTEFCINI